MFEDIFEILFVVLGFVGAILLVPVVIKLIVWLFCTGTLFIVLGIILLALLIGFIGHVLF